MFGCHRGDVGTADLRFVAAGVSDLPPWERVLSKGESTTFGEVSIGRFLLSIIAYLVSKNGSQRLSGQLGLPSTRFFGVSRGIGKYGKGYCDGLGKRGCAFVQNTGLHFAHS